MKKQPISTLIDHAGVTKIYHLSKPTEQLKAAGLFARTKHEPKKPYKPAIAPSPTGGCSE